MPDDPAISLSRPRVTSQEILVVMFDGAATTERGVVVLFETSAGEAAAPFANSGPVAWIAFDGDEKQVEFSPVHRGGDRPGRPPQGHQGRARQLAMEHRQAQLG